MKLYSLRMETRNADKCMLRSTVVLTKIQNLRRYL